MFYTKKPKVMKKLIHHRKRIERDGKQSVMRGFQLNLTTKCNFKCEHCFTEADIHNNDRKLTISDIASIANQADEVGVWELDIQGGEPLMLPDLKEVLHAIKTERFYVYITTNGWYLTQEKAQELAVLGVDKITVSIDYFDEDSHDGFRKMDGSYQKALEALKNAKKAGMTANVNVTVGHYNARSKDLIEILAFAKENSYFVNFNMAAPTGAWRGHTEIVATEDDTRYLMELKNRYGNITRDLWSYYEQDAKIVGCPALNIFYVNPNGDVLPCPYIPIKVGNLLEESLHDILKRGWSVKYFRDKSNKCLTGEDLVFINKYLCTPASTVKPMSFEQAFAKDDLLFDEYVPY